MDCSDFRDDMLDVLYGEASDDVASRFTAHAESCTACRDDLASLSGVRRDLQTWEDEARPSPRRFPQVRYLAVAASVLFAFGAGLLVSRTEVRWKDGEVAVRFGTGAPGTTDFQQQLARYEAEHRAEIAAIKASFVSAPATGVSGAPGARVSPSEDVLLRRVQDMIRASEARQAVVMQTSLSELGQQADAQRRYDLARISAGLSYLESKTGADVARTNELMSHLVRVAAPAENEK